MDYYNQQQQAMHHQQMPGKHQAIQQSSGLDLPDASSSSEKALMWSQQQQYMTESGYSTQAPSISSIDAFLNNEQQQQQANDQQSMRTITEVQQQQQQVPPPPQPEWNAQPQQQQQMQQQPVQVVEMMKSEQEAAENFDENAVANWMNNKDDAEMAMKAIPEMLSLLLDEDQVVVERAAVCFNQMARNDGPCLALINYPNAIPCIVNCINRSADIDTVKSLVGTLYSVSTHKPLGVEAIIKSGALIPLVNLLSATALVTETLISYAITTLHNILLDCHDSVKNQIRSFGAIQFMIPLLKTSVNVKFLAIVVDCLNFLAHSHPKTKELILEIEGTAMLVDLLGHFQYNKLILNITRLIKTLSVCTLNKKALIGYNIMQTLTNHLSTQNPDILHNILIDMRNLSDSATRLNDLEPLIQFLVNYLGTSQDMNNLVLAAGILSNLTCNNEVNKKCALRMGIVHVLLNIFQVHMFSSPRLVEPCVCILRHLTNKHSETLLVQEQVRSLNGIGVINQLFSVRPYNWQVIKAALGLTRNLCSNQLNAHQIRQFNVIQSCTQVFYDAYMHINHMAIHGGDPTKVDNVSLFDIIDLSATALNLLAKDYHNQIIMNELECIKFFAQVFCDTRFASIQKNGATLLAELSTSKECAQVIEKMPEIHQYVQMNFCNQYGALKTLAELGTSNTTLTSILQSVTTMMQRLQEHRNSHHQFMMQQQRQHYQPQPSQQMPQQPPMGMYGGQQPQMVYYNGQMTQQPQQQPPSFY